MQRPLAPVALACGALLLGLPIVARAEAAEKASPATTAAAEGVVVEQPSEGSGPVVAPARHRRSPGLFVGGLVMAVTGGIATTVGGTMALTGAGGCMAYCIDNPRKEDEALVNAGLIVLFTGVALIAVGVPLAVAGGRFDPPAQKLPRAMLVPVVGPGVAGSALTVRF